MQRGVRLAVIGAGPTGALLAAAARAALPAGSVITVLDKGLRAGGRMSTTRSKGHSGQADHGAQYITELSETCRPYIKELVAEGVLQPMSSAAVVGERKSLPNYVAPRGVGSIPQFYLDKSGAAVLQSAKVTGLTRSGCEWLVSIEDGRQLPFDAVVSTLPAPQVLQLGGDVPSVLGSAGLTEALQSVQYSSRYALVCYFDPSHRGVLESLLPYAGTYVDPARDDVIRYVSFDTRKRASVAGQGEATGSDGGAVADPLSVVVHTSVTFGAAHVDDDAAAIGELLQARLAKLYPGLPAPMASKSHKWRFSQVTRTCPSPPPHAGVLTGASGAGAGEALGAVLAASAPPLILAGDSFSQSHFDGCVHSAQAALTLLCGALG